MIVKTEKYVMRQAALDRVNELMALHFRVTFYRGENTYVVKYWVQS